MYSYVYVYNIKLNRVFVYIFTADDIDPKESSLKQSNDGKTLAIFLKNENDETNSELRVYNTETGQLLLLFKGEQRLQTCYKSFTKTYRTQLI